MSLDEYRAIESWVRKESAGRIAELERQIAGLPFIAKVSG